MTKAGGASIHASAVLVGNRAVLIRGPSGSGKSRLAFDLILAGRSGQIAPAILIGDDRVHLGARAGQLIVRPAPALAGLIEIRGLGIRRCDFAHEAAVGLLVDLAAEDAERLPPAPRPHGRIFWYINTANPRRNRLRSPSSGHRCAYNDRKFIFHPAFG